VKIGELQDMVEKKNVFDIISLSWKSAFMKGRCDGAEVTVACGDDAVIFYSSCRI
jgi:hypothetical protein